MPLLQSLRFRAQRLLLPRAPRTRRRALLLGEGGTRYAVCPDLLEAGSVVYSFGIGRDLAFERELVARFGVELFAFDPTPAALAWAREQALPPAIQVHPWGLADRDGTATFHPPRNGRVTNYSLLPRAHDPGAPPPHEVSVRRLVTVMAALGHRRLDLLKLDVEGAEYAALPDLLNSGLDVRQIALEFHHYFPHVGLAATRRAARQLAAHGYRILHRSPSGREFTFVRAA